VFGAIEQMGGKLLRTIGQARANFAMTMMAACYNLRSGWSISERPESRPSDTRNELDLRYSRRFEAKTEQHRREMR